MKKSLLIIGIVAAGIILPSASVFAAAPAKCDLQVKVDALADIKKKADGSSQAVKSELQVRKDLLRELIGCATKETRTLQNTLKEIQTKENDIDAIRDRFVDKLDEALAYYRAEETKVNDLGLRGSKDMAKAILDWRTGNYLPLANETSNLIIWLKNQPLFDTAQKRFDLIGQTVRSLKLLDEEDVKDLFEKAESNLGEARHLNGEAKKALLAEEEPTATTSKIKSSLQSLSATYKSFFELSEAVKKLLPL
jgi:hypothetical protein